VLGAGGGASPNGHASIESTRIRPLSALSRPLPTALSAIQPPATDHTNPRMTRAVAADAHADRDHCAASSYSDEGLHPRAAKARRTTPSDSDVEGDTLDSPIGADRLTSQHRMRRT
jgi:hypothetical protein